MRAPVMQKPSPLRRRALLRGAAAGLAVALAGCTAAGGVSTITVATIAADIGLVQRGLAMLGALAPLGGNPAVTAAVADASGIVAAVSAAAPQVVLPTAQTWVAAVVHDAAIILPIAEAVPALGGTVTDALDAVSVLLDGLQAAVALMPAAAVMRPAVTGPAPMTTERARAILGAL